MRTVDNVHDAVGHAGLLREASQEHRGVRRLLRRLDDEGVAGGDSEGEHLQYRKKRELPVVIARRDHLQARIVCFRW